jgi:SAM-dependent methyltransferase
MSAWLESLRRTEITNVVRDDPRSTGSLLFGLPVPQIFDEVIGGGQADFDSPWRRLSPDDRVLLYAYLNQKGHIEELIEAFSLLFRDSSIQDPVVIDLGCGPFTAGLALAAARGSSATFTYVGVDRSSAMLRFGEKLACAAIVASGLPDGERQWVPSLDAVVWKRAPGWRPVIVVVSYLLASPTLDAAQLVSHLGSLLARIGRGPVTVLYTNAPSSAANRSFPLFRGALEGAGFVLIAEENGTIQIERMSGARNRELRYALFHRQARDVLDLSGE